MGMSVVACRSRVWRIHILPSRKASTFVLAVFVTIATFAPFIPVHLGAQENWSGDWVQFTLTGQAFMPRWGASSVLEAEDVLRSSRYGPEKALDRNPATAWVEGAPGAGIGESYFLGVEHVPEALGFINGYAQNTNLFYRNHRVKELRVHVFAGLMVDGYATEIAEYYDSRPLIDPVSIRLSDTMQPQRVKLPVDRSFIHSRMRAFRDSVDVREWNFPQAEAMGLDGSENLRLHFRYIVQLEIADIYPGSTWEDTCIAELWPDYGTGTEISVSSNMRSLLVTQENGGQIPTYADIRYVISLLDASPDKEWALILQEPAYLEVGERASSRYTVIHTPTGWDIGPQLFPEGTQLGTDLFPLGFIHEEGRTYLEYENLRQEGTSGTLGRVPCTLYSVDYE